MTPLDIETALDWRGRKVVDRDGDKIGTFDELYLDESDRPAWAAVTTGLFGMRQTFVPLSEAREDGDVLQVPFGKEMVKDAPNVDPDTQLDPEEEALLYRHYGLGGGDDDDVDEAPAPARGTDEAADEPVADEPADEPAADGAARTDAPVDDARDDDGVEMVRSEEEVSVGTRRRVSGKARLKKYVVTEHVQKVVPVQREEVRVEFEPAEGERAEAAGDEERER
jgi:stress response protein YsnF